MSGQYSLQIESWYFALNGEDGGGLKCDATHISVFSLFWISHNIPSYCRSPTLNPFGGCALARLPLNKSALKDYRKACREASQRHLWGRISPLWAVLTEFAGLPMQLKMGCVHSIGNRGRHIVSSQQRIFEEGRGFPILLLKSLR